MSEARSPGVVALILLIGSVLAACATAAGPGSVAGPTSSAGPIAGTPTAGAPTSPDPTTSPLATAENGSPSPGSLVIDSALLAVLPADAGGVAIVASPETATEMVADPALQGSASAIAVGAAIDPATSDLAIASVIRLRPGIYSAHFFDDWRADYDKAACEPAGGVSSHASQVIGSHTVDVTVCAQGARTYHVHLGGDVIVSVTAAGERRLGDLVMAGLRE